MINLQKFIEYIQIVFERLTDFQRRYALYDAKRKTLDSVSKLFGIPCKPFPELNKTGEVTKHILTAHTFCKKVFDIVY